MKLTAIAVAVGCVILILFRHYLERVPTRPQRRECLRILDERNGDLDEAAGAADAAACSKIGSDGGMERNS